MDIKKLAEIDQNLEQGNAPSKAQVKRENAERREQHKKDLLVFEQDLNNFLSGYEAKIPNLRIAGASDLKVTPIWTFGKTGQTVSETVVKFWLMWDQDIIPKAPAAINSR